MDRVFVEGRNEERESPDYCINGYLDSNHVAASMALILRCILLY